MHRSLFYHWGVLSLFWFPTVTWILFRYLAVTKVPWMAAPTVVGMMILGGLLIAVVGVLSSALLESHLFSRIVDTPQLVRFLALLVPGALFSAIVFIGHSDSRAPIESLAWLMSIWALPLLNAIVFSIFSFVGQSAKPEISVLLFGVCALILISVLSLWLWLPHGKKQSLAVFSTYPAHGSFWEHIVFNQVRDPEVLQLTYVDLIFDTAGRVNSRVEFLDALSEYKRRFGSLRMDSICQGAFEEKSPTVESYIKGGCGTRVLREFFKGDLAEALGLQADPDFWRLLSWGQGVDKRVASDSATSSLLSGKPVIQQPSESNRKLLIELFDESQMRPELLKFLPKWFVPELNRREFLEAFIKRVAKGHEAADLTTLEFVLNHSDVFRLDQRLETSVGNGSVWDLISYRDLNPVDPPEELEAQYKSYQEILLKMKKLGLNPQSPTLRILPQSPRYERRSVPFAEFVKQITAEHPLRKAFESVFL